ncbi:MAG: Glycerol-3-phosphate acyltransferase [Firmicutes bacterium ADurb.Bin182]|nr:MAG: Glycerol-3-phosphate acyltransferase [Firmicutes bacterium ADurb.Bin182]
MVLKLALCALTGYILGNFQTSVLISRLVYKDDVRHKGSGNAGTTNMLRVFGIKPGAFTFIGDLLKGIAAVLAGQMIGAEWGGYICGLFAVLGHDYPAFFGFRGGKGVATTLGIAFVVSPLFASITSVIGFILIFFTQMVSLGSLIGMTVFFILAVIFTYSNIYFVVFASVLWLLIMLRHKDNIIRIVRGEESKLFKRKSKMDI